MDNISVKHTYKIKGDISEDIYHSQDRLSKTGSVHRKKRVLPELQQAALKSQKSKIESLFFFSTSHYD